MTRTRVKPETREQTEARLQKLTNVKVSDFEDRQSEDQWKLADWVHELYVMYRTFWGTSVEQKIRELLNKGYCHKHGISRGQAKEDKDYHVFRSTMSRIVIVACREDEVYNNDRNSGKKLGRVWKEIVDKKKRTIQEKNIIDKPHTAIVTEPAEVSVAKAGERADERENNKIEHVDTSYHKPKEDSNKKTSKSMFILDENTKWMQTCLSIARESPRLFMQMVDDYLGMLLSPETIAAIRKDLFKS